MSLPKPSPATTAPVMNPQRLAAWGQEMRAVHQRLRDALDIPRAGIEDDQQPESLVANDLQLHCGGFCRALSGHHRSEDAALFPLVLNVVPDLAGTVGKLRQDHSMIAHLVRGLEQALRTGEDKDVLLRHLDGIDAVIQTHFRFEERQLVSLLDGMVIEGLDKTVLYGPIA